MVMMDGQILKGKCRSFKPFASVREQQNNRKLQNCTRSGYSEDSWQGFRFNGGKKSQISVRLSATKGQSGVKNASQDESNQMDAKAVRRREKAEGRSTYRPESYKELLSHAVESIGYALDDGTVRMEVDFPTLGGNSESQYQDSHFMDSEISFENTQQMPPLDSKTCFSTFCRDG